ncbi:tyrosine-type recombinase/integrase [Pirellulales bacterium]|nr:tyrosine-type recombinase/integrase [Pirellulales bacterium]
MNHEIRVWACDLNGRDTYQLQWRDPVTRKTRQKTTQVPTSGLKRDLKEAQRLAAQLELELQNKHSKEPTKISWDDFRQRYEEEHLSGLAESTAKKTFSVLDRFKKEMNIDRLASIDERTLSHYVKNLRSGKHSKRLEESTIKSHLTHLKAVLNWAKDQRMISVLPVFPKIKRSRTSRGQKVMRGRPITLEEFERMLEVIPEVVGNSNAKQWHFYLRGLWYSGLRLSESREVYWDRQDKIHLIKSGPYTVMKIPGELEKGHKDRMLPLAPEFVRLLKSIPKANQTGRVFKLLRVDGKQGEPTTDRVSKIITKIGSKANVIVDTNKTASAHDLRRSFGERWASRMMPADLMAVMRHESIETTMQYYVGKNAERTAAMMDTIDKEATRATSYFPTPSEVQESHQG